MLSWTGEVAGLITLRVPGALKFRDLAVRAVGAACKLVGDGDPTGPGDREFVDQVISAFGEAFNNTAIHSFGGVSAGEVEIEIEIGDTFITIRMKDFGKSYDFSSVPQPDLDTLPESGMGLFIIRSFMDEVDYVPGAPNVLSMTKRVGAS
jgi:serine/threonine-protein kinase RsbW